MSNLFQLLFINFHMAESAVFLNIMRYEKSKSVKKNINHDHRNNYHEFTRSGIFNPIVNTQIMVE